jgi:hypothetical protein
MRAFHSGHSEFFRYQYQDDFINLLYCTANRAHALKKRNCSSPVKTKMHSKNYTAENIDLFNSVFRIRNYNLNYGVQDPVTQEISGSFYFCHLEMERYAEIEEGSCE